jgi:glycerol-3-phosphate O-acyltransferase
LGKHNSTKRKDALAFLDKFDIAPYPPTEEVPMISIPGRYGSIIQKMMANSQKQHVVTEDNVWQEGNTVNKNLFFGIVEDLMLPGSSVQGIENLVDLWQRAQAGQSCMILCEHYSNFDLPCMINLIEKGHPQGKSIADSIVAIAGFKLNQESPVVLAFTEAFSRIVIYPSRSIEALPDGPEKETELKVAQKINLAAMRALSKAKTTGKIVLVFPSGTRYRPGKPETKRGVKEIDSYMKSFDCAAFMSINGNTLHVTSSGDMIDDQAHRDVILYGVSPVVDCNEFRKQAQADCPEGEDSKQFTVDRVMATLEAQHNTYQPLHDTLLKKAEPYSED